jgi:hypothetical protein
MESRLEPRLHVGHMEFAVANLIGWRENTIVPNVSWGLGLSHEADLLVLDKSGRFTEIEIKISLSDLKADFKKWHGHQSHIISRLVYAVPHNLVNHANTCVPKGCGIISVKWHPRAGVFQAEWVRRCVHKKGTAKPSTARVIKFMSLGCMRIWSLKGAALRKQAANGK